MNLRRRLLLSPSSNKPLKGGGRLPLTMSSLREYPINTNGKRTTTSRSILVGALALLLAVATCGGALYYWILSSRQTTVATTNSSTGSSGNNNNSNNNNLPTLRNNIPYLEPSSVAADGSSSSTTSTTYSVIVVGCGPAGLTAALFAARASLSVLVFGSTSGGLLSQATELDNFPSFATTTAGSSGSSGNSFQWLETTQQQAARAGAVFALPGWYVTSLQQQQQQQQHQQHPQDTNNNNNKAASAAFRLQASANQTFWARSVIVATGATPRRLHVSGPWEDQLWGRYIHSCAVCDAGAYGPDDVVLVVGGGDAAVAAALYLARRVRQVVLVHRKKGVSLTRPQNRQAVEMLQQTKNIELRTPFVVKGWKTNTKNNSNGMLELVGATLVHATDPSQTQEIACAGAFLMIGATPNTEWLSTSGVQRDENGYILAPHTGAKTAAAATATATTTLTSVPGIFAAGEVVDSVYRQAITAAGEGAQAAMDAERWLATLPKDGSRPVLPAVDADPVVTTAKAQPPPVVVAERKIQEHGQDLYNDCDDLVEKDCIMALVQAFPVVVFSKPWCPYCKRALEALVAEGVGDSTKIRVVDLTKYETSREIQNTLKSFTGRHTVPNVFIGGISIGGGDETIRLHREGKLGALLRDAGAIG